ncbi:MAG: N-acetylmuramoyl-L-alanine amidase [Magnetococcales bacterium]|nr:N-acetylmuramoyl-L-alanine amidase [Magnetococcales bacterium]
MVRRELLKALIFSASGLILPASVLYAGVPAVVTRMRLTPDLDHTRVVFDLDKKIHYSLQQLTEPDQVVLEMPAVRWGVDPAALRMEDALVKKVELSNTPSRGVRLAFLLNQAATPRATFLQAVDMQPPRLLLDLLRRDAPTEEEEPVATQAAANSKQRSAVVVIDPGHGGEDPGAIGAGGTYEKTVTLEVARKLARELGAAGYKAHLTRTDDYFVPLRKRVAIARHHGADLFVSLHADAFRIPSARGASVYCLSERGKPEPDQALRSLVERENSADLIGGVDLGQVDDPELRDILMDLSQRNARNQALAYGNSLLSSLKKSSSVRLHFRAVKQAGFAVLKAPDIPSVLVEMAFLSNRDEEKQLRKQEYQDSLVRALAHGTQAFFRSTSLA